MISSLLLLMGVRRTGSPRWCHWGVLQREEVARLLAELAVRGNGSSHLTSASPWERGTMPMGGSFVKDELSGATLTWSPQSWAGLLPFGFVCSANPKGLTDFFFFLKKRREEKG